MYYEFKEEDWKIYKEKIAFWQERYMAKLLKEYNIKCLAIKCDISNDEEVLKQYRRGLITNDERYKEVIKIWEKATDDVAEAMKNNFDEQNPIFMMAQSGARRKYESITSNCWYAWTYGKYIWESCRNTN